MTSLGSSDEVDVKKDDRGDLEGDSELKVESAKETKNIKVKRALSVEIPATPVPVIVVSSPASSKEEIAIASSRKTDVLHPAAGLPSSPSALSPSSKRKGMFKVSALPSTAILQLGLDPKDFSTFDVQAIEESKTAKQPVSPKSALSKSAKAPLSPKSVMSKTMASTSAVLSPPVATKTRRKSVSMMSASSTIIQANDAASSSFEKSNLSKRSIPDGDSKLAEELAIPDEQDLEEQNKMYHFRSGSLARLEALNDREEDAGQFEYHLQNASILGDNANYTTVLVRDPRKFKEVGYSLQFQDIQMLTVITMYNESADEVVLTLRGVLDNLKLFHHETKDPLFWKKFAVCIVSDGREKANQRTLEFFHQLGIYDEDLVADALSTHKAKHIGCHLFESTLVFTDNPETKTEFPPLQIMVAMKEHNAGKIDSHWWFFEAFAASLNPMYCFLLDVGTKPRRKALYRLYRAMERNYEIAGACGEITTRNRANTSFIVSGQHFEYKIAGILDKAMESLFGYISVLPGAFSAYRYSALVGKPLRKYFHHIEHTASEMSPFEANMYLAEDRILCFELFAKKDHSFKLHFVSDSVAETDVPDSVVDLLKQRRRWLNGSFFASVYAVLNFDRVLYDTSHNPFRKIGVCLLFFFYMLQILITLMLVGGFYLSVYFLLQFIFGSTTHPGFAILHTLFLMAIVLQFLYALTDKPQNLQKTYHYFYLFFGFCFLTIFGFLPYYTVLAIANGDRVMLVGFILALMIYFIVSLLYGEFMSIFTSFFQYLFMAPTFLVMFPMYSFCNVHDVSWGTKNLDTSPDQPVKVDAQALKDAAEQKKKETLKREQIANKFIRFRSRMVSIWLFGNLGFASIITRFEVGYGYLKSVLMIIIFMNGLRLIGSFIYFGVTTYTRYLENQENEKEIRSLIRSGKISREQGKSNPLWYELLMILLHPFQLKSIMSAISLMVASPAMELLFLAWTAPTAVITILLYPFSFLHEIVAYFMITWRGLVSIEFQLFSNDGFIAKLMKTDSQSKRKAIKTCPKALAHLSADAYIQDEASWKPLLQFLMIKPFFLSTSAGLSWTILLFSISLFYAPICDKSSQTCKYSQHPYTFVGFDSKADAFAGFIVGILSFYMWSYLVVSLDQSSRRLTSATLGDPFFPLELKSMNQQTAVGVTEQRRLGRTGSTEADELDSLMKAEAVQVAGTSSSEDAKN